MASSSCDPLLLQSLQRASEKRDVRSLMQEHDIEAVNAAWRALDPIDRAALHLMKAFDGTVIHDYDPTQDR
jgi:hypothetical protein